MRAGAVQLAEPLFQLELVQPRGQAQILHGQFAVHLRLHQRARGFQAPDIGLAEPARFGHRFQPAQLPRQQRQRPNMRIQRVFP